MMYREHQNCYGKMEHDKSSVRCKIEHAFLMVKNQMGYAKVAYCEIEKNMNRFNVLFASANLLMCTRAGRTQDFVGGAWHKFSFVRMVSRQFHYSRWIVFMPFYWLKY